MSESVENINSPGWNEFSFREKENCKENGEDLSSTIPDSVAKKRKVSLQNRKGNNLQSDIRGYMGEPNAEGAIGFNFSLSQPLTGNNPGKSMHKRNLFMVNEHRNKTFDFLNLEHLSKHKTLKEDGSGKTPYARSDNKQGPNAIAQIKEGVNALRNLLKGSQEEEEEQTEPVDKPEEMSSQQIIDMLYSINSTLSGLQIEMKKLNDQKSTSTQHQEIMTKITEDTTQVLMEQQMEMQENKWRVSKIIDFITRQDQKIEEVKWQEERRQLREGSSTLYIDNILVQKDEDCIDVAQKFINEKLKIVDGVVVTKAYRTGQQDPPSMCVIVRNSGERAQIFKMVSNLKDTRNENKQRFFLNKQLPARIREEKRREREIIKENYDLPKAQRSNIEKTKDGLMIDDQPYKKMITAPQAGDLLKQVKTDRTQRRQLTITGGNVVYAENQRFHGYSAFIQDFKDISNAYMNVRERHADARHICCAYRLPGNDIATLQDYVDDDEPGGGRKLLEILKEMDSFHRVIFVARYYDGTHLGMDRFQYMKNAALSAIIKAPRNKYTGEDEFKEAQELINPKYNTEYSDAMRGRPSVRASRGGRNRYTDRGGTQRKRTEGNNKRKPTTGPQQRNKTSTFETDVTFEMQTESGKQSTPYKPDYLRNGSEQWQMHEEYDHY